MGNGTSIGRVRGLGSAKTGVSHWLVQRFTAIGNLLLGIWLVVSILLLPNMSYATVIEWIVKPVPAMAIALFVISTFWHSRLGLQVAMEDYVHEHGNKFALVTLLNFLAFAGAGFGVFCIIRLALGAHA